jgi:hypothetical protein
VGNKRATDPEFCCNFYAKVVPLRA